MMSARAPSTAARVKAASSSSKSSCDSVFISAARVIVTRAMRAAAQSNSVACPTAGADQKRTSRPSSRAMTSFWISLAPSPMVQTRLSR